jgi:hypothetical protein
MWHFVCTGKCLARERLVGAVDAAGQENEFPHSRYRGMWKTKHELVSAKKIKARSKMWEGGWQGRCRRNCPRGEQA